MQLLALFVLEELEEPHLVVTSITLAVEEAISPEQRMATLPAIV